MNPDLHFPTSGEPVHRTFGRTAFQILRAAVLFAAFGSLFAWLLIGRVTGPYSPLGTWLQGTGLDPAALPALGVLLVLGLAAYGAWRSRQQAPVFAITDSGLWVRDGRGVYCLPWPALTEAEVSGNSLRITVRDATAVLQTHRGTDVERELLADALNRPLYFPQVDLGRPPAEVLGWLRPYLQTEAGEGDPSSEDLQRSGNHQDNN